MQGQRTTQGILWSMVTGLMLLGGMAPAGAADAQTPAGQLLRRRKKAPEKKSVKKKEESEDHSRSCQIPCPEVCLGGNGR